VGIRRRIQGLENDETRAVGFFDRVRDAMLPDGCTRIEFLAIFFLVWRDPNTVDADPVAFHGSQQLQFGNRPEDGRVFVRNDWFIRGPFIPPPLQASPGNWMQIDRTRQLDAETTFTLAPARLDMQTARAAFIDSEVLRLGEI